MATSSPTFRPVKGSVPLGSEWVLVVDADADGWLEVVDGLEVAGALLEDAGGVEVDGAGAELAGVVLARGSTYC
jgi:hypothetical protein